MSNVPVISQINLLNFLIDVTESIYFLKTNNLKHLNVSPETIYYLLKKEKWVLSFPDIQGINLLVRLKNEPISYLIDPYF